MYVVCTICVFQPSLHSELRTSTMAETAEVNATVSVSDVLVDDKPESKDAGSEVATANGSQPTSEENTFVAPADKYWTVDRDGAVKLRVGTTEYDKDTPITVHELFKRIVEKAGDHFALAVKRNDQWQKWTYAQYMQDCRTAGKGFIKVMIFKENL